MLIALSIAAAVSAAQIQSIKDLTALDLRVAAIGDRLARTGLCSGFLSNPGWIVQDEAQYRAALRPAARAALGLGDGPTIVALLPESAAAQAGLRPGDRIEAIGGQLVGRGGKGYARLQQLEAWTEQGLARGALKVRVRRADTVIDAVVQPRAGCPTRFQLLPGPGLNAKADGSYVQVSGAMVEFVANDDELALVIAHELAHNILGHRARLDAANTSRGLFAGFGKNGARIRASELEADRLALYLMARAGYDPAVAPAFWQRFGRKLVPGFLSDGTHPGTGERVRRAQAEIARIRAQQAAGRQPTP